MKHLKKQLKKSNLRKLTAEFKLINPLFSYLFYLYSHFFFHPHSIWTLTQKSNTKLEWQLTTFSLLNDNQENEPDVHYVTACH